MAKTYSNTSSVLGYELINEPWVIFFSIQTFPVLILKTLIFKAGDIYADPLIFLPGFADAFNLLPMYDKTYNEIRKYDQDTLVFYEPVSQATV